MSLINLIYSLIDFIYLNPLPFLPFLISSTVYLATFYNNKEEPSLTYFAYKCSPLLSQGFFVLFNNPRFKNAYKTRILLALMISTIADVLICFQSYFLISVLLFAITHLIYIYSFGFKPLRIDLAILIFLIHVSSCYYFVPYLKVPALKLALPAYVTLLLIMVWRSMSRVNLKEEDPFLLAGALGAILFGLSDLVLCYNVFVQKFPFANFLIMFTYYYAQFGISLTILSRKNRINNWNINIQRPKQHE